MAEYLFSNLDFAPGVDAVLMVSILLDRLASLTGDPDRMKHLRAAVRDAQATPVPEVMPVAATDDRVEALRALRAWYTDWAETARAVLTRRDHLIRVGLATRKRSQPPMPIIAAPSEPPPAPPAPEATRALPMSTGTRAA